MIDEQTKQLIIDTVRIEDVVSDFVQLRRKGSGFVGLCPFHKDRHPSFLSLRPRISASASLVVQAVHQFPSS